MRDHGELVYKKLQVWSPTQQDQLISSSPHHEDESSPIEALRWLGCGRLHNLLDRALRGIIRRLIVTVSASNFRQSSDTNPGIPIINL
ncbi:unnamed protein product [Linum trigynum]|uniref:Uncharacterized protein n=1 Tax=Linum trigynum TaxID=586398 RepID=A0AAV2GH61_9ROSI